MASQSLTQREFEILALIARGYADKEIASKLNIVPATVKNHFQNIKAFLRATNRANAVYLAAKEGII